MRTAPYFLDTFPKSRRPDYPRFKGEEQSTVVIVGGGLTGCASALACAAAGVRVVLLEGERVGQGMTARSVGLLRQSFDASFHETTALYGLRTARHLWTAMRRASLDFAAAFRRFGIRADLNEQDLLLFARDGAERRLKREYQARRDAGLDVTWLNKAATRKEADIDGDGALRTEGMALDPYRACVGLAAAAAARGAAIHEKSRVRRIRFDRKSAQVICESGTITATTVLVATGAPTSGLGALRRHFRSSECYAVVTEPLPAAVRREVGRRMAALRDMHAPPHVLRWMKEDRVLFSGADQPPVASRLHDKAVAQRSMQLMYELSTLYPPISGLQPAWAWSVMQHESADGLPIIGPHRNFPHQFFSLGHGRHGAGLAWLTARVLLRHVTREPARGDELFGFARIL
jgi:glycine/D-amino acid oxidase-like deaminating enzyme